MSGRVTGNLIFMVLVTAKDGMWARTYFLDVDSNEHILDEFKYTVCTSLSLAHLLHTIHVSSYAKATCLNSLGKVRDKVMLRVF